MKDDTKATRKARAASLRKQIKDLKESQQGSREKKAGLSSGTSKSPAEFIRDRMNELDKKES